MKFHQQILYLVLISSIIAMFVATSPPISSVFAESLEESAKRLQDIQRQIEDTQQQLNAVTGQKKTLKSQLDVVDTQAKLTELKMDETNTQIERLEKEIAELSNRINRLSTTLDSITEILLNRIIQTYKIGAFSSIDLFFSSNGFSDLLLRNRHIQAAQASDKKKLYELQATKATYNDQRGDKESRQKQQEKLKNDLVRYQTQLKDQKKAKEELLAITQNDEQRYQSIIERLRADAESVRRALAGGGIKKGPVKKGDIIATVGMTGCTTGPHLHFEVMTNAKVENNTVSGRENKTDPKPFIDSGQFGRPLDSYSGQMCNYKNACLGDITALYGASGDNYIKGFPAHTGLDIAERIGTPLKAVADGIAYEFSDSKSCSLTGTVGKGVVVDHGDGFVTLYWHIP